MDYNDLYIILVAGGTGTRMGGSMPKQFLEMGNEDVLTHTLRAFVEVCPEAHYIIVIHGDHLERAPLYRDNFPDLQLVFVEGGSTRFESSRAGLSKCPMEGIIFIHDAARPFVSADLIHRLFHSTLEHGCAVPSIPLSSSVRMLEGDKNIAVDRSKMRIIQTPQAFRADWIKDAYVTDELPHFTDDASVLEHFGYRVFLVEGDERNFKITTPEDLEIARCMQSRTS